jgi:hypothetical protein
MSALTGATGAGELTLDAWDKMNDGERMELFTSDREAWLAMIEAERKRGESRLTGDDR